MQELAKLWKGVWLWRISGGGQSHNWVGDWPFD